MDGPNELLQDIVETTEEDKTIQIIVETTKVTDELKQNALEIIKHNYPKLDPLGVELMYEQHNKAYQEFLKHIEEMNSNFLINPPTDLIYN